MKWKPDVDIVMSPTGGINYISTYNDKMKEYTGNPIGKTFVIKNQILSDIVNGIIKFNYYVGYNWMYADNLLFERIDYDWPVDSTDAIWLCRIVAYIPRW